MEGVSRKGKRIKFIFRVRVNTCGLTLLGCPLVDPYCFCIEMDGGNVIQRD